MPSYIIDLKTPAFKNGLNKLEKTMGFFWQERLLDAVKNDDEAEFRRMLADVKFDGNSFRDIHGKKLLASIFSQNIDQEQANRFARIAVENGVEIDADSNNNWYHNFCQKEVLLTILKGVKDPNSMLSLFKTHEIAEPKLLKEITAFYHTETNSKLTLCTIL